MARREWKAIENGYFGRLMKSAGVRSWSPERPFNLVCFPEPVQFPKPESNPRPLPQPITHPFTPIPGARRSAMRRMMPTFTAQGAAIDLRLRRMQFIISA